MRLAGMHFSEVQKQEMEKQTDWNWCDQASRMEKGSGDPECMQG